MFKYNEGNRLRRALPLIAIAVLGGCFYESAVPLAPVNPEVFDQDLLGTWLQTDANTGESPLRLAVFQFTGPEYYVEVLADTAPGKWPEASDRYRGYLTSVEKTMFMNVQELKPGDRPYMFFRIKRTGADTLAIAGIAEDIAPQFASSEKLLAFVEQNLETDSVFATLGTFKRLK